jgi:hypothetical protein
MKQSLREFILRKNLTTKQQDFVQQYIATGDAIESVLRSYACKNRNVARVIAHRNRNNKKIQDLIEEKLTKTTPIAGTTIHWKLETMERILRISLRSGIKKQIADACKILLTIPFADSPLYPRTIPVEVLRYIVDNKGTPPADWVDEDPDKQTQVDF